MDAGGEVGFRDEPEMTELYFLALTPVKLLPAGQEVVLV
jgi:hypothetical protein